MTVPLPNPLYTVLPAAIKSGVTVVAFVTSDYAQAELAALQATAANNVQYIIYTSTSYTEKFSDLPQAAIDALVFPFPVPVVVEPNP